MTSPDGKVDTVDAGTTLGPYEIIEKIGAGGMGEVYRARDSRLGRDVAIKVLPRHLSSNPEFRARLEREARALSQLNHPNICALYDVGRDGSTDYLVMEFIAGQTVAKRLEQGPLVIQKLLELASEVLGALEQAHRAGLIHRDLKPANLMLTDSGVKLLDFGLARPFATRANDQTLDVPLTSMNAVMGTIPYMAPEQLSGGDVNVRTDIFAFGSVLHELATGRRPFGGDDGSTVLLSMLSGKREPLTRLNQKMPWGLEAIVNRCLEQEPGKRYQTASELRAAIEQLRRWVPEVAIPQLAGMCDRIMLMEETRESYSAFELAREIDKLSPREPLLERLRPEFSHMVSIESDPPGASAWAKFYGDADEKWTPLGTTPLREIQFPRGLTQLRLELDGYCKMRDLLWGLGKGISNATDRAAGVWRYSLRTSNALPEDMEEIPAGGSSMYMPGLENLGVEPIASFLMDRNPVTNGQFKKFLDQGGYARREFWTDPFLDGSTDLTHEQAMARFVDAVGQPGPAGWEMGEYPAGEHDHPVSGVSWYEASAYAKFVGKILPTLFHFNRVAFTFVTSQIAPLGNFSSRGTVAINTTRSENRFGVRDLAGNVREWVSNPVNRIGEFFILGGGWNDPEYAFVDAYAQSAFDRSLSNGFRCILPNANEPNAERLARTIDFPFRDFFAEQPVSDETFEHFRRQFDYDKSPLDVKMVCERQVEIGIWQTVEFAAAYGRERMQAHVLLPSAGQKPLQTVVMFPGSLAIHTRTFTPFEIRRLEFLVKSGRAVILPIYKSTYERGDDLQSDYPEPTAFYKDHVVMWGKDLSRTIDYIESRDDLDASRIAYYGMSWGGALGAILPAIEPRIRTNVLYVAGLCFQRALPEVDQINYLTRVTQPTLMLNGELDFFFPAETSQRPMFERLGTPAEHKKRLTYPRGHTVPKVDLIRESLKWLDQYLGSAK